MANNNDELSTKKTEEKPGLHKEEYENQEEYESIYDEATEKNKDVLAQIDFDIKGNERWLLKVIGGPNNGAEFAMQTGQGYVLGTDPASCDIVFHDTSVSRQHARLTIKEDNTLAIEDLKSRNGTLIDGQAISGSKILESNSLTTLGTTSFVVFDRERDMDTIISPLLPSIVKVLQKDAEEKAAKEREEQGPTPKEIQHAEETAAAARIVEVEHKHRRLTGYILMGILSVILVVVGLGTATLFQSQPFQLEKPINYNVELAKALKSFSSVHWSYNPTTGQLLLVGHVLTASDKSQLLFYLQRLNFIKNIDDSGLIVDEYVWKETNTILDSDPRWRGISVHSPTAGTFVISGYLKTRKQAEELNDYITSNFPYLDLLQRRVIVEEDVLTSVEIRLHNSGLENVKAQLNNGELNLSGKLPKEQIVTLNRILPEIRDIPGVRTIKTFISEVEPEQTLVNLTDRYPVTGFSHQGGTNYTVVINGRILSRGDLLDGMTITTITPTAVFLEKDGIKYRIDYNQ